MIVDEQQLKLLKTNSLFKGVSYSSLKPHLKPKNFFQVNEGEIIYKVDDEADNIYLIVEGEVKIKFPEEKIIKTKYILDFFGEREVLEKSKRVSHALANLNCILYKTSNVELDSLFTMFPQICTNIGKITNEPKEIDQLKVNASEFISANEELENEVISFDDVIEEDKEVDISEDELDSILNSSIEKQKISNAFRDINKLPKIADDEIE